MMAPEYPTPTMLALDKIEVRLTGLIVARHDKRDAAAIFRREASELLAAAEVKNREADVVNARIMRMDAVRSRVLRAAL